MTLVFPLGTGGTKGRVHRDIKEDRELGERKEIRGVTIRRQDVIKEALNVLSGKGQSGKKAGEEKNTFRGRGRGRGR